MEKIIEIETKIVNKKVCLQGNVLERKYPRPRIDCDCGGQLVLKWGDKIKPYLAHLPGKSKNCSINKESLKHKLAKKAIIDFLSSGGIINVKQNCCQCDKQEIIKLPIGDNLKYFEEYKISSGIADVAIVDNEDNVLFVVEVYKTSKTKDSARLNYNWCELKAEDILNNWDNKIKKSEWEIKCIRDNIRCDNKCLSMYDLGISLGYINESVIGDYKTESRREIEMALKGYYTVSQLTHHYCTTPINENNKTIVNNAWKEINNRKKCIKCETYDDYIGYNRPYCKKCYIFVNYEENDDLEPKKIYIEKEEKLKLRTKYGKLLRLIPIITEKYTHPHCCICNGKNYNEHDDYNEWCVWWFGNKKRICTLCLENKRIEIEDVENKIKAI